MFETRDGENHGFGWKFLTPWGTTPANDYCDTETAYPLPEPGERWSAWMEHPAPETDGRDSGPGRYHVMRTLDARYAPSGWWPWFVEWEGCAGRSNEKVGVHRLRLRRVSAALLWYILRRGWGKGADLSGAHLSGADLSGAHLSGADLTRAHLARAHLTGADLYGANLTRAHLVGADLYGANLTRAHLVGANLTRAYLTGANLVGARYCRHTVFPAGFTPPDSAVLLPC